MLGCLFLVKLQRPNLRYVQHVDHRFRLRSSGSMLDITISNYDHLQKQALLFETHINRYVVYQKRPF